jgi:hypothetical protein
MTTLIMRSSRAMRLTNTVVHSSAVRRIWKAHGLQPHRYRQFKLSNDPNFVDKQRDVVGLYVDPPAHAIVLSLDEKSQIQALDRTQPGLHFTPTSCSWLNAVEGFFARLSRRRLKRGVFRSVVDLQAAINGFLAETNAEPKPFTWTADPDKIIAAVRRGHQTLDSLQLTPTPAARVSTPKAYRAPKNTASAYSLANAIRKAVLGIGLLRVTETPPQIIFAALRRSP